MCGVSVARRQGVRGCGGVERESRARGFAPCDVARACATDPTAHLAERREAAALDPPSCRRAGGAAVVDRGARNRAEARSVRIDVGVLERRMAQRAAGRPRVEEEEERHDGQPRDADSNAASAAPVTPWRQAYVRGAGTLRENRNWHSMRPTGTRDRDFSTTRDADSRPNAETRPRRRDRWPLRT